MVRKLLKSLLSLSMIAPLSAFGLGLGDVHLRSALGERLQADIELLSVSPAEADSIRVSLASQATFDKVGLERPSILMLLEFKVEKDAAGNYAVKISSRESISEPFLDFLVEVDWKSGRVLREYTLLLDPPTTRREAAPAVTAPAATTEMAAQATTAPEQATTAPEKDTTAESSAEMVSKESVLEALRGASGTPPEPMADKVPAPAAASGGIVYGPVKANETLWQIADKLRQNRNVSVQQMMVALLKANPYAFFDNNINRLKRGFVLRIDDPELLSAMSQADAAREVARQTRVWQDYRERAAARAKQRPAETSAMAAKPGVARAAKSEPKLTLVAPEGKGVDSASPSGSTKAGDAGAVNEQLMLAMENSAAQRKENEELQKRLTSLEGQLKDMEKIISLKDADLAALQKQLREQGKAAVMPSEQMPAADVVKPEEKPELVVKAGDAAKSAEAKPDAMAKPEKADEAAKAESATVAETGTVNVESKPVEAKPQPQPKPAAAPKPKKKPVVRPAPVQEPSLIDSLLQDPMMMGVGGGTVVLLLLLVMMVIKRRRKGGFQESILNAGNSSMIKASDEQGSETSFLSDLAISGMGPGTIQTDEGEVDPLTEADVFMAYGRNQQAEEVLKKAREKSPDRADIAAKLLEVYYNTKDKAKFEALAEEAVGGLQGNDELWSKVLGMGYELCPDNVLFEAGAGAAPRSESAAGAAEAEADTVMDIGLDLDELTAEMEGEGGGDMDLDLGLDFADIGEESDTTAASVEAPTVAEESASSDLDMGELDFDMASAEEGEAEDSGLDFDLDLGAADEVAEESASEVMDLDDDLGALVSADEESTSAEEFALDFDLGGADEGGLDMDLGDFDLGELEAADEVSSGTVAGGDLELDMALDDLGGLDDLGDLGGAEDEMTTKLDLAQAYAEMGDAEGARSMLEEVVAAGNADQKQQAQALIDKL